MAVNEGVAVSSYPDTNYIQNISQSIEDSMEEDEEDSDEWYDEIHIKTMWWYGLETFG